MASKLPQITIVGAGLSGLTLGLSLRSKGIAAVLYDRAAPSPRYNYGITLYASTYRPFLSLLDMDESSFRESVAVNAQQGGTGSWPGSDTFRCHRGRLEALLSRYLSINWDKRLKEINMSPGSRGVTAVFEDGYQHKTTCLIGCDGPHSMTRQSRAPSMKLEVLPYVVFNGKRRMSTEEYMGTIHEHMRDHVQKQTRVGNVLLEISVTDIAGSKVELSYIYSRATDIPDEFYEELRSLKGLEMPFREIFDADKVEDDRTLHWLMRCLAPEPKEAQHLSEHGVLLIGDAVHATPILGGEGAQIAIQDGLDLAEYISTNGVDDLWHFAQSKYNTWKKLT
ncbi:hypothetical protein TruAng_006832 [Truncatella angustata]|nr:hypothetical protein TruAng_006832 [Truncatella angustata]